MRRHLDRIGQHLRKYDRLLQAQPCSQPLARQIVEAHRLDLRLNESLRSSDKLCRDLALRCLVPYSGTNKPPNRSSQLSPRRFE